MAVHQRKPFYAVVQHVRDTSEREDVSTVKKLGQELVTLQSREITLVTDGDPGQDLGQFIVRLSSCRFDYPAGPVRSA